MEMKKKKKKNNIDTYEYIFPLLYEFWYDYVKPKYCEKVKFCYMDTGRFIVYLRIRSYL